MKKLLMILALVTFGAYAGTMKPTEAPIDPLKEYRVCGEPARDKSGTIARSAKVRNAYRKIHPCPSNGSTVGTEACPGWAIDHIIPLAVGGCDSVSNMAWMPDQIKSCASQYCIDRWERKYYGDPHGVITFDPAAK